MYRHAITLVALLAAFAAQGQFTVRLGIYPNRMETEYFTEKGWKGSIQELKHESGYYHYHTGSYTTWLEAEVAMVKAKRMAWDGAEIVDMEEMSALMNHPCPYVLESDSTALNTFFLQFEGRTLNLSPQVKTQLRTIAEIMKAYPDLIVQITGHTDNEGDAQPNRIVSGNRARAVRDHLRTNFGISGSRIFTVEAGESAPLVPNTDQYQCTLRNNQMINNRVTVTLKRS